MEVRLVKIEEELRVVCIEMMIQELDEIRVMRGVVYKMKSKGPKIEP